MICAVCRKEKTAPLGCTEVCPNFWVCVDCLRLWALETAEKWAKGDKAAQQRLAVVKAKCEQDVRERQFAAMYGEQGIESQVYDRIDRMWKHVLPILADNALRIALQKETKCMEEPGVLDVKTCEPRRRNRKPTEKKRSGYFKGVAITDLTDKQFVEACEFAQVEIGRSWKSEPVSLLAIQLGATMELAQEFARRWNRTKENTTSEPSNTETEPDTVVHED